VSVTPEVTITAKLEAPAGEQPPRRFFVLAHGANNDLDFPLLAYLATHLAETADTSVVRFNFPYSERGVTSPDPRPVLESTFSRVYEHVVSQMAPPGTPVFIGGKSLGGRAAAELVSRRPEGTGLDAAGLVVLGYPLHKPGEKDHLFLDPLRHIDIPSLFCIGSHDSLCDPSLLRPVLEQLVPPGELYVVEGGDHSLHLPHSQSRQPHDSYEAIGREVAGFITRTSP
jgi:predicted alpha/beta-hydrolase family hydrolase